jgi:hypothetical protein
VYTHIETRPSRAPTWRPLGPVVPR